MKKSRTSIFRTLILALVLSVTVFILVFAWFTNSQRATANDLSVQAVSDLGLQCSFDNNEYLPSIARAVTDNFKFPLITGNGSNFFIPALDRSAGTPLLYAANESAGHAAGSWKEKREPVPAYYTEDGETYTSGDYYVEDIWFQSDKPLKVYLTDQSSITPLDAGKSVTEMERKSEYGDFSKDNIAGAARVAFFQLQDVDKEGTEVGNLSKDAVEKDESEFIWIPNDKYQLTTSENLTPISSDGSTSSGVIFDPDGTPKEQWWNDLLVSDNDIAGNYHVAPEGQKKYLYYYDFKDSDKPDGTEVLKATEMYLNDAGEYVGVMDIEKAGTVNYMYGIFDVPMDQNGAYKSQIGDFTHEGDDPEWVPYDRETHPLYDDDGVWIFSYELARSRNAFVTPIGSDVNLKWAQLYLQRTTSIDYSKYDRWQIRITFNPETKVLNIGDVILYQDKDHYITTPTIGSVIGGDNHQKYTIPDGSTVVITNNTSSTIETTYGLNAVSTSTNAVRLLMKSVTDAGGNTYITPQNPLPSQLFKAQLSGGTYIFTSLSTGKYLAIENGKVVLSETASLFTLEGKSSTGPMLKSADGYYITFSNSQFGVSTTSEFAGLQIYQGSAFAFTENGASELTYTYYMAGATALTNLTPATLTASGYLLSTGLNTKPVVTLEEQSDGKYKGHIRIKIWVEGTDREAKIPLAGGIFSTHLAFMGVDTSEQVSA